VQRWPVPHGLTYCWSRTIGALKTVYLLITIMLVAASHPQLGAQEVSNQATPIAGVAAELPDGPDAAQLQAKFPEAVMLPPAEDTTTLVTEADTQSRIGNRLVLDGNVVVTFRDRRVEADHIEYDEETGDLTATGHLKATGGVNDEVITASHGTMNLRTQTGRFYDVKGSVGRKAVDRRPVVYTNSNPFLFTGRMVVKTGPQEYEVYDGTVTSCQLPRPDWQLYAGKFTVDSEKARASHSVFRLVNVPLLYLPYVTHPVDTGARQSGILIPEISNSSTKGLVLGEQFYWAINRSSDLTVGAQYFSRRGWEQSGTYRYRGLGNNFAKAHYNGLLDRGYYNSAGQYVNQGGEDATFVGRYDFSPETRVVATAEYLSSYAYRQAFTENFNQAVSTDILSNVYGVHQASGYMAALRVDRYQGLKAAATTTTPEEQVRIFHAPSLDLATTEHKLGTTDLEWSVESSIAGLKRVQPNFATAGLTNRFDLHPELALPLSADGWRFRPSIGVRETIYSRSRVVPYTPGIPVESGQAVNRADVELGFEARAPVVERTFDSKLVEKLFGSEVRHTIEPEVTYRYVSGVGTDFLKVLRFDDVDVVSNTNELEYGTTQRLFVRRQQTKPCKTQDADTQQYGDADMTGDTVSTGCGGRELISWRLTQKYFFDNSFGGAVINGRRNIFDTTLALSGVAFLTEPREISPLISRLRMHPSDKLDAEWDFDLDTGAKKFTSNNVLVDLHEGNTFAGLSYARLNAPGRFYTEGVSSSVSNFSQLRVLLGYGAPTKSGLSVAANAGLDLRLSSLQYAALQFSYNWDCCGFSVEYRKYELGSVRNESVERFNFTLVNIGTAGNLRKAERLF
jgi:LPS-assembly protein